MSNTIPFYRPVNDDVWLGVIKDRNSDEWHAVRWDRCEKRSPISGHKYNERQCAVLNMSVNSYDDSENMVYAVPCDGQRLGFVCKMYKGEIPKGREMSITRQINTTKLGNTTR
jgi:hypothetical protein